MNNTHPPTIEEMKQILEGAVALTCQAINKQEMYAWIEDTLRDSRYLKLKKKQRGVVRHYIQKLTGLKKARLTRLIKLFKETTRVQIKDYQRHKFKRIYTVEDVVLLAAADLVFLRTCSRSPQQ